MRSLRAFRRAIEPIVYWLFLGSLICLLAKALILNRIPAPALYLGIVGDLFEAVLRSLLAGTVFYVTVTATKTYGDRKRLAPWLVDRLNTIVVRHEELLDYLRDALKTRKLPQDDWETAFSVIISTDPTPEVKDLTGARFSWQEYLKTHAQFVADYCSLIGRRASFIEPDIVRAATELENSVFVTMILTFPERFEIRYTLASFYPWFVQYGRLVETIQRYRDEVIRDYKISPPAGGFAILEQVSPTDETGAGPPDDETGVAP